jgi:CheY-like chemotaxis protein
LNVLVADDTQANQKVVKAVLSKRGHHVALADNGRQALDQIRSHPYDVVLMDAQMPMMNGLEATAAIRHLSDHDRARVPIIAMTAHAMQEDRMRCLAAGMDDYLPKPIDVAALIARVEFYGNAGRIREPGMKPQASVDKQPLEQDFLAGALARLAGDETLLLELIRLFQQDAEALLGKIKAGVDAGDRESVGRAAHNLRGLTANFDDKRTIAAATYIERAAEQGNLPGAQSALPELEAELSRLLDALARYQSQARDGA